jgi:NADPH:quinone reductase-like Zn-dependent oxidoreductase
MVGITNYRHAGAFMNAAVVRSFDSPPRYESFPAPEPCREDEIIVDVLAAGLHPRVRSGAAGSHYTSEETLPMVPGVDGVGRDADGRLLYFVALDGELGTMAERTAADRRRTVLLTDDADILAVAAGMNPGMSSWVALRRRVPFQAGQRVLVHGATGNAGRMAVQIAKLLGASQVSAAGRDPERLEALTALGADVTVSLAGDPDAVAQTLGEAAREVDFVIDYLWGAATELAIPAVVKARAERSRPLTWIQIGSMAGATIALPSAALRAANLQILGSGQGSVTTAGIVSELPELADRLTSGSITVDTVAMPLQDVESAWDAPVEPGKRVVFVT